MTSYKEITIGDEILAGDIITIKGPNEHDITVREVSEDKSVLIGDSEFSVARLLEDYYSYMTITKIERSVPELKLEEVMLISLRERKAVMAARLAADQRAEYDDTLEEERERLRLAEAIYKARPSSGREDS